ncbi:poly(ethylene terephthalate) hydrolase family protein [Streptomyces sp. NBC_01236]|uniref:poly(ethylene terephthalate) hydrolase family protein n=1 Tax=Streptomyces sp. NBC_01236 TaxID=2903789 RepID=UPI002E109739|nr:RICIN domain-containing protein [Streptomyces sp. NBC_01236]
MIVAVAGLIASMLATLQPASAAGNPYQRGPDPTVASVAATSGPFPTTSVSVPPGNGFNGGTIYYPTDTSLGTWGAVAIVPGYTARFADEEAWMGPWLSSFGFVVIGVETNSRTDYDTARGTQLLAALDYLTRQSPVRDRVDPDRLAVIGHSMGGGGVISASERRPSLKAAIALAPYSPSQNLATDRVPTMVIGGQNDTVVTPSYLDGLYASMPAATQSAFLQIAGADHVYYTHPNNTEMKVLIPWLKTFVDNDTRHTQFLCPTLADPAGISIYHGKCPYIPPTTTPPGGSGALHAVGAGKCLDVPGSSTSPGVQTQIWDCDGAANQTWSQTASHELTVYSGNSRLCLDASNQGTSPGTKVITWTCNGQSNQQWNLNADGTITNVHAGLCLDVTGAATANGSPVELWTCNGASNQRWALG